MQPKPASYFKNKVVISVIILGLIGAGVLVWSRHGRTPGADEVAGFLNRTVGGTRVRFFGTKLEALAPGDAGVTLTVATMARTIGPLYAKTDTAEYLRQTFRLDPALAGEARKVLNTPGVALQPEFERAAPFPPDPYQAVILRATSPAGATLTYQGVIDAQREGGAWKFTLISGAFEGGGLSGESRSVFGEAAYALGEAADETRLHALVADFEAFAGRVAALHRELKSARSAAVDARRNAFLAQIAPGRVFRGTATEAGTRRETPVYLEIVALAPEKEVTAVLRNENSWRMARAFQGTWSADEQFEKPVLHLTSAAGQAVRNAGPFLDNTQEWRFSLNVDSRGELAEQNRFFQYRFQPITPEQVAALQARLDGEFLAAVAATESGALYLGTAVSRTTGATESVFLRFGQQPPGSESLEASLESTMREWKRPLHGTIIANARRSGGAPIRLQTSPSDAVPEAASGSALSDPGELNLRLGLEQGALVGDDERFTYRLAVPGAADLQRLEASRSERVRRLANVVRDGIVYDGLMREDRGYLFRTRLEFTRVDRPAGVIVARFRSLERLNVFREFRGTWDPAGDSLVLTATEVGVWDKNFGFNIPFFVTHEGATLHLALAGNSLTGRIVGEPHWAMEFAADAFLAAPAASAESNAPSGEGSGLPVLPKNEGAYLLSNGSWLPLPANHGHVVSEPAPDLSEDEEAANALRALKGLGGDEAAEKNSKKKGKEKVMVSFLDFDGKDPRPAVHGPAGIVLLFVGPESAAEPAIELARARTLDDGRRRVKLVTTVATAVKFGEQRLAAYVRTVAPNATVLTTTSAAAPGIYIFNAGAGYELTQE